MGVIGRWQDENRNVILSRTSFSSGGKAGASHGIWRLFLSVAVLFLACASAHAFPTWMGAYESYPHHNGINPGKYTILMNQDYVGLHAEVGIQINGSGYSTYTMNYIGNADGNSVWQYEVETAYGSNDYVQFYFHGWDDWGGNIYDNNDGWNYCFTAGAAELDWVGNSILPAIIAGHDTWVGIESWPRNAGVDAFSIFAYDGTWGGATLGYSGVTNNNDLWHGSIGRFSASSEVQIVLGVEDEAGYSLYDNNNGSNYIFIVQPGEAVQWLGDIYHWPTNGALTSTNDLWLNLFAYPSQTVVQAYALYAVNGMIWQYADLSYLDMDGTNEWWHTNLGLMPPGANIYYLFNVEDGAGIWQVVPSNGTPYTATVSGDSIDSDDDALPDDWEQFRFGTLGYSTTDNPDHDGYTAMPLDNWMEYCIGADPAVSNQTSDIRLMWYPSRPFQSGWVKLSVAANTNEDLYGTSIEAVVNDGSGAQTVTLSQATSGRFETALQLSSNTSSLVISRLTGNGSTDDNYTLGWNIPVRALASGETADSDGDGLPDEWETTYGLDPLDDGSIDADNGAAGDPDGDGISNLTEYQHQLNPQSADSDTDSDGIPDSIELMYGLNPSDGMDAWKDLDGDRIPNVVEYVYNTALDISTDRPSATLTVSNNEIYLSAVITQAVGLASNGYPIISVMPGTYTGYYSEVVYSYASNVTLIAESASPEEVILDARGVGRGALIYGGPFFISGFTISNGYSSGVAYGGGIAAYYARVSIQNCIIENCSDLLSQGAGVYAFQSDVSLENCVIQECWGTDYALHWENGHSEINHCSILNNHNGLYDAGYSLTLCNSILWGNTGEQLSSVATSSIFACCIEDGFLGGVDIIEGDPLLVGWRMVDTNSPAFGVAGGMPQNDIDGESRKMLSDLGADEWSSADRDDDSLEDWWELKEFASLSQTADDDPDNDDLNNAGEYANGTQPKNYDSDGDLLADGAEISYYSTNPLLWDSLGSGSSDSANMLTGNGVLFRTELIWNQSINAMVVYANPAYTGTPYDFFYIKARSMGEGWYLGKAGVTGINNEAIWYDDGGPGLPHPFDLQRYYRIGLANDPDGDSLGSAYEYMILGTSPDMWDTDGDGISDGDEDFDGDGISNAAEYNSPLFVYHNPCRQGSSRPTVMDSDGDGISDGTLGNGTTITSGPDYFPMDPYGLADYDCDGLPDTVNTNFATCSEPPLILDVNDDSINDFSVWAPNATSACVKGAFNGWNGTAMTNDGNGYWYCAVANVVTGQEYKYYLSDSLWRPDPVSQRSTSADHNSVIPGTNAFAWTDGGFTPPPRNELVIYQMHIGGFNRTSGAIGTFKTATNMLDYIVGLGVNAVKVMPIWEFSTSTSWGYNPVNPYAVESDYGTPDDFKIFVNACHERGLAVILDVVYNHFAGAEYYSGGLMRYDGWTNAYAPGGIYFYEDTTTEPTNQWLYLTEWGPRPNYKCAEVRRYLRNNAMMWIRDYHCDGLRWDATSMIRNYDKSNTDDTSKDIPEGWTLMQQINNELRAYNTNYIAIAEDLLVNTNNRSVTVSTALGGAGFDARWSPFYDTIRDNVCFADPWVEKIEEELEFTYASDPFDRVIFVESHDEVGAFNTKIRFAQQIANAEASGGVTNATTVTVQKRAILGEALVFTAPGIPMFFMGEEFLEAGAWSEGTPLTWSNTNTFSGVLQMHRDLIALRKNEAGNTAGLLGTNLYVNTPLDDGNNVLAFHRYDQGGPGDDVMVIANMSGNVWNQSNYSIGFPTSGVWKIRFCSDWKTYNTNFGGIPSSTQITVSPSSSAMHGHPYSAAVNMGAYSVMILSQDAP